MEKKPAFARPKWRKPAPLSYGNAIDSVGSVAAPLLAGFSLASVIVVSDDSANFRWPGAAILALTIAAVMFVGAVQCSYNARQYLWSASDVSSWWPEVKAGTELEDLLRDEQAEAFRRWTAWSRWIRITYNYGILALLAGLGLGLAPLHGNGAQAAMRWVSMGVAFAACAGEVSWFVAVAWRRSREAHRTE